MIIKTYSAIMQGLSALKIEVECQCVQGKPDLIIIGLAAKALDEAKERISNALDCCHIRLKRRKTVVNLAPADVKKADSCLELAIAVALYKVTTGAEWANDEDMFFGELALSGELRPLRGALSLVLAAKEMGFKRVFIPKAHLDEVKIITGVAIYGVEHLQDIIDFLEGNIVLAPLKPSKFVPAEFGDYKTTLSQVIGQEAAKRCLEIAAAGGHNLLLMGVPGAGKSMLASSLASILPPLTEKEAIEITKIYSASGLLANHQLITVRPFRCPHHSVSTVGLVGGSSQLLPGEISLAHRGILFLDELAEFRRDALEALRQPLESGEAVITRASGHITYPANFTLIAATNPCPCGNYGSKKNLCTCSATARDNYQKKLSGPILDRIDMQIYVNEVETTKLIDNLQLPSQNDTQWRRERVNKAREKQRIRLAHYGLYINNQLSSAQIRECCVVSDDAKKLLHSAINKWQISARSYFKVIKVAQTICDLSDTKENIITTTHLAEALQYRFHKNNSDTST